MSAEEEVSKITKLGIIAGSGALPAVLVEACKKKGITPYIVAIKGFADPHLTEGHNHIWSDMGTAGKIISYFQSHDVHDLVMIGGVKRPSFKTLKPDLKGLQIISRIGLKALGDDGLLSALKAELKKEGLRVHGIHKFCDQLLAPFGPITKIQPTEEEMIDVRHGMKISQAIGAMDIGQSVIVQNGVVIGVEAIEGTDQLIQRCADLQFPGRGGVLVKSCKPQQDRDLDIPTIGLRTVEHAHQAGLKGIAIHANHVIIANYNIIAEYADKYGLFVIGVSDQGDFSKHVK